MPNPEYLSPDNAKPPIPLEPPRRRREINIPRPLPDFLPEKSPEPTITIPTIPVKQPAEPVPAG